MDKINVFISYSSEEKLIGGRLKQMLVRYCGYDAFIAHDDIPGSEIWEKEIVQAIKKSDFFIPLISKSFIKSPYTDQETGCAVCMNKKIIPIKLDNTNPYGFINKIQALSYKTYPSNYRFDNQTDNLKEIAITIAHIGFHYKTISIYYKKSMQSLVEALCNSESFDTTNAIIRILLKCNHQFSNDQIKQILKAIQTNSQIIGAFGLPELKNILKIRYHCHIE